MLYSLIARHDVSANPDALPVSPSLIFIQRSFSDNYDPTIFINKEKVIDVEAYASEYKAGLKSVLTEIFDKEHAFVQTENPKTCQYCAYRELCGK